MEERGSSELDASVWLHALWRRRFVILAVVGVGLLAAVALNSQRAPTYRASSEVLVQSNTLEGIVQRLGYGGGGVDRGRALANEVVLINSDDTRAAVAERLGYSASVRIVIDDAADLLTFSTTSSDPERAAEIVNAYVDTFIERRRQAVVDEMVEVTELLNLRRSAIADEREQLAAQLDERRVALSAAVDPTEVERLQNELEVLEDRQATRLSALDAEESGIETSLSAVNLANELRDGGDVRVVTVAAVPSQPISASPLRAFLVAGVASLMAGVALALLLEVLDNRIAGRSDLERASGGLPVLAMVPGAPSGDGDQVASIAHPQGVVAEAYRSLRTAVQFLAISDPIDVVLVTSAASAEGKTATTANLGVALSRLGKRVVLLDCDLRKPRLGPRFGLEGRLGMSDVLLGTCGVADVAVRVPGESGLVVIPSGSPPPNPSELLASARMAEFLRDLKAGADVVVIDSPPVLPVTDSRVLTAMCDGVLVVARAGHSQRRYLQRAVELLRQLDAPLLGTVLVNAAEEGGGSQYLYYGDYADDVPDHEASASDAPAAPSVGADRR